MINFNLVARNSDLDPRETYLFHTTETLREAVIYARSKEQIFKECGGWTIEIENVKTGELMEWQTLVTA